MPWSRPLPPCPSDCDCDVFCELTRDFLERAAGYDTLDRAAQSDKIVHLEDCLAEQNAEIRSLREQLGIVDPPEVSIEIGRSLRPGWVEASVLNGHRTAVDGYPWAYRERPAALIRELAHVEPNLIEPARAKLPRAHRQAAEVDRPRELRVIEDTDVEGFVEHLPPDLEVPGWHGLTLSRDWFAPTLVYARRGVGKSWAAARMIHQLAGEGLRSLVIATEGVGEWAKRVANYPENRRPKLLVEGSPDAEGVQAIAEQVERAESYIGRAGAIGLVVVDVVRPLFRRLGVSENDSECVDALIQHLEPLYQPGRALLLVAHSGKEQELGVRGSSAIEDAAGTIFELTPPDEDDEPEDNLATLAIMHPRKFRAGPLDSQPTLRLFFGKGEGGRLLAEPYEPPDPAARREDGIIAALERIGGPCTIRELSSEAGGRVTTAQLARLADKGRAHTHEPARRSSHPLWVAGPRGGECCTS